MDTFFFILRLSIGEQEIFLYCLYFPLLLSSAFLLDTVLCALCVFKVIKD